MTRLSSFPAPTPESYEMLDKCAHECDVAGAHYSRMLLYRWSKRYADAAQHDRLRQNALARARNAYRKYERMVRDATND